MRILVVDDHALVRQGIVAVIRSLQPGHEVLEAESCAAALALAAVHRPELVFLDLQLPDRSGFSVLEAFREHQGEVPVVVVSAYEDRATVLRALDLGAKAFVPKSMDASRVRDAISDLLSGRIFLPSSVTDGAGPLPGSGACGREQAAWQLTERQREVLGLLVSGLSNKLIARRLEIAESTVKIHVSAILRELKVTSRTQVLIVAARRGIRLPLHRVS